mgnify:CR=1 FL=1
MNNNDRDLNRQKVSMALYLLKENNEQELLKEWEIYIGKKYVLGRGKDNDIDIDSLLLSRRHIELIYYSANLIQIKDLNSRNGTYINNSKVEPNQEIKFSVKDKLSLGETNNKLSFFEKKDENPSFNRNIESNRINNNNNYIRRNRRYYDQNRVIRSQPQSQNNDDEYVSKLIRQLKSGNNNVNYIQNRRRRFIPFNRFNNRRSSFSFTQIQQNREKDNQNVFVGRKVERNISNKKNDNEKVFKSKKEGLEKLKKKLKSVDVNEEDTEKDGEEDEEEEEESEDVDDIIDIDEKEHKNEKIILKTNKLNKLEFTLPLKGKNLKNLKGIKKVKCLVSGYVVLNVKKKQLIYE